MKPIDACLRTCAWTGTLAVVCLSAWGAELIPASDVKLHFQILQQTNPKLTNLFKRLVDKFETKSHYSIEEIRAIVNPPQPPKIPMEYTPKDYDPERTVKAGTFPAADVQRHLSILSAAGDKGDLYAALIRKYGRQHWYTAAELRDVQNFGSRPMEIPGPVLEPRPLSGTKPIVVALQGIKVRKDWTDLLFSEDLTIDPGRKSLDDLVGATFSYAHDGDAGSDTWTAMGAVIAPIVWRREIVRGDFVPELTVLSPSITINRVDTSGDSNNEVDQILYRLGMHNKWLVYSEGLTAIELRTAAVYGTDFDHDASLPAVELDFEPQFFWKGSENRGPFGLGYKTVLIPKQPRNEDGSDNSLLDLQLRTWLHLEGGNLQRNGAKWETQGDTFFRLGPTLQGQLNFPELLRGFSITAQYAYLPEIHGPGGHDSLVKLSGAFTLFRDPELGRKFSLTASFVKGGLQFTKQEVNTISVGLGLVY